jgi:choline kinase
MARLVRLVQRGGTMPTSSSPTSSPSYSIVRGARAVILAAGNGTRLAASGPKALLEVGGLSILERQVRALRAASVREIVVVVGYQRERLVAACDALAARLDVHFTFVANPRWAETNTAWSMALAAPLMVGAPTFTLNGDVLFPRAVLAALASAGGPIALAIDVKPCGDEEVKVTLDAGDRLLAIDKRLDRGEAIGEFIGIARFDDGASEPFARALAEELAQAGPHTYYDYALRRLPPALRPRGVRFTGVPMIEIDFPEDLARARVEVEPRIRELDREALRAAVG